jgi:CheY-like chemotaxis protein
MNVLIVEDDENKGVQFSHFMRETFSPIQIKLEKSLQGGLRAIRKERPDLVLLDMTLPNYDPGPDETGGITHIFGGREFLRQMDRFDIDVPVIVVTQFETFGKSPNVMGLRELDQQLRNEHAAVYRGAVYYHASLRAWKDELRRLVSSATGQEPVGDGSD